MELIARLVIGISAIVALATMLSDENKKYFDSTIDKATMLFLGVLIFLCFCAW